MEQLTDQQLRIEALDRAVRSALGGGAGEKPETTVRRAEQYLRFLQGQQTDDKAAD